MIDQLHTANRHWYLIRLGVCGETVRCLGVNEPSFQRGDQVVLQTSRGEILASVMQLLSDSVTADASTQDTEENQILRIATEQDIQHQQKLKLRAKEDFSSWADRIQEWEIEVELIDLEWTLDGEKLMLYVLNRRGPECTKLAMQAAAQGFGVIDVIPVSATGIEAPTKSGCGCGSGGCSQ